MGKFIVRGGNYLNGTLKVPAAKNAFLPALAACLLTDEEIVLKNNPGFSDIENMIDIMKEMGVEFRHAGDDLIVCSKNIRSHETSEGKATLLRSSICLLGSTLAKLKKCKIPHPGGCKIGARPIDLHISGLQRLGAKVRDEDGCIVCECNQLVGAEINLRYPSVGATENILLASVLAEGRTTIKGYAKEPEVLDMVCLLSKMGGEIKVTKEAIIVDGVKTLHGTEHEVIPDRIIAGTYMIVAAMCGGCVRLENVNFNHIKGVASNLSSTTCKVGKLYGNIIEIKSAGHRKGNQIIETMPYPGFATDVQNQMLAYLATADGTSIVTENIFENRFKVAESLNRMGANISVCGKVATIKGVSKLHGQKVQALDLRGGASLVLAGLVADGETEIDGTLYIDRGYKNLEVELGKLGGDLRRIDDAEKSN